MSDEVAKWIVGLVAAGGIGGLVMYLKSLVAKIDSSVSREEFLRVIQQLKLDHEQDRRELRENQISIFSKLEAQNQTLTMVATKLDFIASMRPFDQTYPGRSKP